MDTEATVSDSGQFPPGPGLPDPALESLENIWSSLVPELQNDHSFYDQAVGKFVNEQKTAVENAERRATEEKNNFIQILERWDSVQDETDDEKKSRWSKRFSRGNGKLMAEVRANISKQHSWEDVLSALREAESHYSNPTGIKIVHKWFRKATDKSAAIEPYIDFIPSGTYTSVICTGLTFILQACAAAKKFREESFDLINRLPDRIDLASQYSELYKDDFSLQVAAYDLYYEILYAIKGLIHWLLKDHTFEFLKVMAQQTSYDPLEGRLEEVGKKSARFEEVINLCNTKKLAEISKGVNGIRQDLTALKNQFLIFMQVSFRNAQWFEQLFKAKSQTADVNHQDPPVAYISKHELLSLLLPKPSYSPDQSPVVSPFELPLDQALHAGFRMDETEQARTRWMMNNSLLSKWFQSTKSRMLLVNGNHKLERLTPTSFFCSMLAKSLGTAESIVVLTYFCGLGTLSESEPCDDAGLLRDLIGQLVTQWRFGDLTCLEQRFVEKLKKQSPEIKLKAQRRLLHRLIAALPQKTPVFVFIDGINYIETEDLVNETKKAMKELSRLVYNKDIGAMVKVFVTSSTTARDVNEYFENDEVITVPESAETDTNGLIDLQFKSGLGSQILNIGR
ncbi:hypothetical protein FMEXI_4195 [Fusarium mexicanum]|uniref:Nephrocystin 3-like N-terminal domain-containing protein n=1 Tax=Fusarium mexicanum TaxID=751941 RepID=A0A8H5J627_9HYPO|nr:hypothetical protein FMEXI_4195 [Fusarium mexicanum]